MKAHLLLIPFLCVSCTAFPTPDGYGVAIGGKGGYERSPSGAVRAFWDNEKSLQDVAIAAVGAVGLAADAAVQKVQSTEATKVSGHRSAEVINGQNINGAVQMHGESEATKRIITLPK